MGSSGVAAARFFHLDGWNGWRFAPSAAPREVVFDRRGLHLPPAGLPPGALARPGRVTPRGLAFDEAGAPSAVAEGGRGLCLVAGRAEPPPPCWGLPGGARPRIGGIAADGRGRVFLALPDEGEVRVVRLSPPGEIARIPAGRPGGLALDGRGRLFVLDLADAPACAGSDAPACAGSDAGVTLVTVRGAEGDAIAAAGDGLVAVVRAGDARLRIGRGGAPLAEIDLGRPALPAVAFDRTQPAAGDEVFLFVGDQRSGRVVRWHVRGGKAAPTGWSAAADAWSALAYRGGALFGLGAGCAVRPIAMEAEGFHAREGRVVLGPLDAGLPETEWHRVTALVDPPPSAAAGVRVEVLTIDEPDAREAWDPIAAEHDPRWTPAAELVAPAPGRPAELALRGALGRCAWVRLTLHGDGRRTPFVRWVRVEHPRASYLRYLPAIYGEDPASRDLTARLLSLFEAAEVDLGAAIARLGRLFAPLSADPGWLPWLAERLGVELDPAWPVPQQRAVLAAAIRVHRRRGTRAALEEVLGWYAGPGVRVVEAGRRRGALLLGGALPLGCATVLPHAGGPPRIVLGHGAALGAARLERREGAAVEPLLPDRGEILVHVPPAAGASPERLARVQRAAEREAPAGTRVRVLAASPRAAVGLGRLGLDAALGRRPPFRLPGAGEPPAAGPALPGLALPGPALPGLALPGLALPGLALIERGPGGRAELALGLGPRLGMDSKL
ncbi:phage tail protein [Sorangium sp. So ce513]|uniref:phage tail protein n=1 Tax=Sorangium sp. So ce513 TaxID=3133315 RepID=UPI003F638C5E